MGDGIGWVGYKTTKTGAKNASVFNNSTLTNDGWYDNMIVHTVVVCPFVSTLSNMVILPQEAGSVKW